MSEKQLVLVLGMHRSGTSLVTSLIEANGFSCGKYPMKPSKDNPNGYWEDELIVGINEKLLSSLGLYWFSLVFIDSCGHLLIINNVRAYPFGRLRYRKNFR